MFTGIIEAIGRVRTVTPTDGDVRLCIEAPADFLASVQLGDSIATSGVCLTVIEKQADSYVADVSTQSLCLTTIQHWQAGSRVNLERALTPEGRLGGHMVTGHVDGIAQVVSRTPQARSECFVLSVPPPLAKYIATKGSVTLDGTSLTVNQVDDKQFHVNIVPHTLAHTIMDSYQTGTQVNIEVDLIARYLERLLGERQR